MDAGHQRNRRRRRRSRLTCRQQPTKETLAKFFDESRAKVKGKFVMVGAPPWSRSRSCRRPSGAKTMTCARSTTRSIRPADGGFGGGPQRAPQSERRAREPGRPSSSISSCVSAARWCASTTPAASTDRFARSTTAPSTSRRRCPPSSCATRTTAASRAARRRRAPSSSSSTSSIAPIRKARPLQRRRGDPRQRQGRGSRDARRPSRFVARRHRRHRQRHRLRGDDGGGPHPAGDRRQAAPHDPRSRSGAAKNRACSDRRRMSRSTSGRPRTRSPNTPTSPATSTSTPAPAAPAACRCSARPKRRAFFAKPPGRSKTSASSASNATQSRRRGGTDSTSFNEAGLPGIGIQQDPIEYELAHLAHQSRHLRADHRGRREEVGDGDCLGGVSPGDARSDAAAAPQGPDAGVPTTTQ